MNPDRLGALPQVRRRIASYAVLTIALGAATMSVHAQGLDVAGGYGYAAIRHEFDWKNYQGFWLGTSLYVRPWLGIVGEFDRLAWSLHPVIHVAKLKLLASPRARSVHIAAAYEGGAPGGT